MKHNASNKTLNKKNGGRPQKRAWWKIAIFTLAIVLTAGAVTYTLTTRNSAASSGPVGNGDVPSLGSNTSQNAPAATGVGDLNWVKNLPAKFADQDFIFVILPGSDINSNNTLAKRVADAAAKIEARDIRVETITLSTSDPEISITAGRLGIAQLPAVIAIPPSGNGLILTGDITEGKLLQAYVTASQPVCAPGSSPGCCP